MLGGANGLSLFSVHYCIRLIVDKKQIRTFQDTLKSARSMWSNDFPPFSFPSPTKKTLFCFKKGRARSRSGEVAGDPRAEGPPQERDPRPVVKKERRRLRLRLRDHFIPHTTLGSNNRGALQIIELPFLQIPYLVAHGRLGPHPG